MSVFSVPQEEYRRKSPSHVNEPVTRRGGGEEPRPALCRRRVLPRWECGVRRTAFCLVFLSDLSCPIWKETASFGINFQADWKVYLRGCGRGFFLHVPDRDLKPIPLSLARSQPRCHKYAQNFSSLFISPTLQLSLLIYGRGEIRTLNPTLTLTER